MSKVIILGAGASKSYSESYSKAKMPIAIDFFETFRKLDISKNLWVIIGDIINYVKEFRNVKIEDFDDFKEDIEILHSEIQSKLYAGFKQNKNLLDDPNNILYLKAYNQLIFLFVSVINEVQNGPISSSHIKLAKQLSNDDSVITFNWDTLMDRALNQVTNWSCDFGYFMTPKMIYRDKWVSPAKINKNEHPIILKLHGSSNWLTSHTRPENGRFALSQETPIDDFFIYQKNKEPYSCYSGRYMDNYEDFSYGYYPPNLPLKGKEQMKGKVNIRTNLNSIYMPKGTSNSDGLVSMPLIIPPVQKKEYDLFGNLFSSLWKEAEKRITEAEEIYIIGYSFPKTDYRSSKLFKSAFIKRNDMPKITIINPAPELIEERFIYDLGITKENLTVIKDYFTDKTEL